MIDENGTDQVQSSRAIWPWIILLFIVLVAAGLLWIRQTNHRPTGIPTKPVLTVGYQTSPAMALIMVAEKRGYFRATGTTITLQRFAAGKLALQAFLAGSLDVAVAGDMPTGLALLQGQNLTAFAEVIRASRDEIRMVVRNAKCNRANPAGYFLTAPKKRIATSFGGGPHYFSYTFLRAAGVPLSQVELKSYAPPEMVNALKAGEVDGIAVFDPAAAKAEQVLGKQACTYPDPQTYRQRYIAVAAPDVVTRRDGKPDQRLVDFVAALRRAEAFIAQHPDAAKRIVQAETSIDMATIDALWPKLTFGVSIDPVGIPALWMQEVDFNQSQPGANFPVIPKFAKAVSTQYVR